MIIDLSLILVMGVLYAVGVYLVLARTLTRVLLGLMLISNATNLLIVHAGGPALLPTFYEKDIPADQYTDPLPQALTLTAIVIGAAMVAFVLGMIYRGWVLARADEIQDDDEDLRVATSDHFDTEEDTPIEDDESEFEGDEESRKLQEDKIAEEQAQLQTQQEKLHQVQSYTDKPDEMIDLAYKEHHLAEKESAAPGKES